MTYLYGERKWSVVAYFLDFENEILFWQIILLNSHKCNKDIHPAYRDLARTIL